MTTTLTPSEQLTHSTVRISCRKSDGKISTGTGFFYRCLDTGEQHLPVVVTNKHVVKDAVSGEFHMTLQDSDGMPKVGSHHRFEVDNFGAPWIPHPDPNVDLCVMPIGGVLSHAANSGLRFFYVSLDKSLIPTEAEIAELSALEDVIMIGYPVGIWDAINNMPIIRRGVTATHPNLSYNGKREFMIDAACFPGSSGSPVFLFNVGSYSGRQGGMFVGNRIKLLGLLYAGPQHVATGEIRMIEVPTEHKPVSLSSIPINLGLVIKSERLVEMDEVVRKHLGL